MRGTKVWLVVAGCIIAALLVVCGFFAWQYTRLKHDPAASAKDTTQRIISKVSALYAVPADEQPTVARIQDKGKLNGQAFFDKALTGDYLLVYPKAKLALVYREAINKLIVVGPVGVGNKDKP